MNRSQVMDTDAILNFLGMREWPRLPHSPRGTCVPNLRTTCSTCSGRTGFWREDEHAAVLLVFLGQRHFVVVRLITVERFLRVSIGFARSIGTFAISDQAVIALIARFARKCRNWPARCHLPRLPERACPTIQAPRQDGARCLRCRR